MVYIYYKGVYNVGRLSNQAEKETDMTNQEIKQLAIDKGYSATITIGYDGKKVAVSLKNRKPSRMEVMDALNLSGADYKVKSVRNLVLVQKRS